MRAGHDPGVTLDDISRRLGQLENQAELIKTVLIVKEPNTIHAAEAFEGLRKQILASSGERRAHLSQLVAMAVAVARASSLDDVRAQLGEWMSQAGIVTLDGVPKGHRPSDLFEALEGTLEDAEAIDVEEPAYVDGQNGSILRTGRARPVKVKRGDSAATPQPANDAEVTELVSDPDTKGSDA